MRSALLASCLACALATPAASSYAQTGSAPAPSAKPGAPATAPKKDAAAAPRFGSR